MGSVIDIVDCKRCGKEAYVDFNYKTSEEYEICNTCGAGHSYFLKRDEDKKPIIGEEGKAIYTHKETVGNGIAHLMFNNNVASLFTAPNEVDKINDWLEEVKKEIEINPNIVKEKSYITLWDYDKNELAVVYGEIPEYVDFEDCEGIKDDDELPF